MFQGLLVGPCGQGTIHGLKRVIKKNEAANLKMHVDKKDGCLSDNLLGSLGCDIKDRCPFHPTSHNTII